MNLLMSEGIEVLTEESPMNMSDAVLVSTAKAGDANAFVELSKRYSAGSCGRRIASPGIGKMRKTRVRTPF